VYLANFNYKNLNANVHAQYFSQKFNRVGMKYKLKNKIYTSSCRLKVWKCDSCCTLEPISSTRFHPKVIPVEQITYQANNE